MGQSVLKHANWIIALQDISKCANAQIVPECNELRELYQNNETCTILHENAQKTRRNALKFVKLNKGQKGAMC